MVQLLHRATTLGEKRSSLSFAKTEVDLALLSMVQQVLAVLNTRLLFHYKVALHSVLVTCATSIQLPDSRYLALSSLDQCHVLLRTAAEARAVLILLHVRYVRAVLIRMHVKCVNTTWHPSLLCS